MANSQNGWAANKDPKAIGVVSLQVAGVSFPNGVKGGDVHTVFEYVATQFSKTVERLMSPGCWGYDYKPIEGSKTISNHASGTAIDINAPHHPMGSSGTFTSTKKAAIKKILDYCDDVVRWGGDYVGRKDEMHFEIIGTSAQVAKLAAKIKGGSSTTPPASSTELKKGDNGASVMHLQSFLHDTFPAYKDAVSVKQGQMISVDGDFGDQTEAWVKEFQTRTSLLADGEVGPNTHAKLREFGYKY